MSTTPNATRTVDAAWLADQLRRGFSGDPWHGWSMTRILEGVAASTAAARPLPAAHSIWEIVLHVTAWARECARRLAGAPPAQPLEGDWPPPGAVSPESWDGVLAALAEAHVEVERAMAALPPERWSEPVVSQRDPALGTGVTYAQLVNGLVQHDAYHAGQIALLKKWM